MLSIVFALVGILCLSTNAFVNFEHAVLFDEFDLSTYKTFLLPQCYTTSCKVYVSSPDSSLSTLENIYLGDTTLATIAKQVDEETGLKTPYTLKAYSGKAFISNLNFLFKSAPVAIYIVYQTSPFYNTGSVVDPSTSPSFIWTATNPLTVLSATNFTIKGAVETGSLSGGRVIAAGYGSVNANSNLIPSLYDFLDDKSFELSFAGPLATLYAENPTEVKVSIGEGFKVNSALRTFLTSPGYTGLPSGQVYRSSLYNKTVQYRLTFAKESAVQFDAFLNTFVDSVDITVDGLDKSSTRGSLGTPTHHQIFNLHGREFLIIFKKTTDYSSFLLKIVANVDEEATTRSSESPSTDESIQDVSVTSAYPLSNVPLITSEETADVTQKTDAPMTNAPLFTSEATAHETHKTEAPIATDAPALPAITTASELPKEPKQPDVPAPEPESPEVDPESPAVEPESPAVEPESPAEPENPSEPCDSVSNAMGRCQLPGSNPDVVDIMG